MLLLQRVNSQTHFELIHVFSPIIFVISVMFAHSIYQHLEFYWIEHDNRMFFFLFHSNSIFKTKNTRRFIDSDDNWVEFVICTMPLLSRLSIVSSAQFIFLNSHNSTVEIIREQLLNLLLFLIRTYNLYCECHVVYALIFFTD